MKTILKKCIIIFLISLLLLFLKLPYQVNGAVRSVSELISSDDMKNTMNADYR